MPTRIEKLQAYASHLLDGMIYLRERYEILEPMMSEAIVQRVFGGGKRRRGFEVLRYSLLLACMQDIAKYTADKDPRTPSVQNIMSRLADEALRSQLREQFAVWNIPIPAEYADDPELVAALERINAREESERRAHFDSLYADLCKKWEKLQASSAFDACRTVRDKISAHTEIKYVADKYQPVKISDLGMTRTDLRGIVNDMQDIVELIGLLVRNASFAWDMLDEQLATASRELWKPPMQDGSASAV